MILHSFISGMLYTTSVAPNVDIILQNEPRQLLCLGRGSVIPGPAVSLHPCSTGASQWSPPVLQGELGSC